MKKFDGYLLVSDIDGTLAEGRYINPANITAINNFVADGGQVVLATGRSPQSSVPVAKDLGCSAKLIANNGAVVYDTALGKVVSQQAFDCKQITMDVVDRFSVGAVFYCGEELLLVKENEQHKEEMSSIKDTIQNNTIVLSELKQLLNDLLNGGSNEIRN